MKRRFITGNCSNNAEVVLVETNPEPLGHALVNQYSVNKANTEELVKLAEDIQQADDFVKHTTCSKLKVIADQMAFLKQQAASILLDAKRDFQLHHAACNFQKIPGREYHLYERPSGQQYFSIVSPEEWGASLPHKHLGSYFLDHDRSWKPHGPPDTQSQENIRLLKHVLTSPDSNTSDSDQMMIDF